MDVKSQATLAVHCEFGENPFRFELPVTSLDQQIQLLHHLTDAYTSFLKELTPDDSALVEMVKTGIEGMAQLSKRLSKDCMEARPRISPQANTSIVEKDVEEESERCHGLEEKEPLPLSRSVGFRLGEAGAKQDECEVSEEEDEPPPMRQLGMTPHIFNSLDDELSASHSHSIGPKRASCLVFSRLQAAMREFRFPNPRTVKSAQKQQNE
eukprot:TRINITY_DN23140_c0_g1_i1.p1 TRINITY_DN23140_c0_g1~~TRINITY_DN23140_c0_g1_i1.p1  ORF type:complete len:237 (-),score=38.82 TRINITY_DN23140_c0_g1_i1:52-681(-)